MKKKGTNFIQSKRFYEIIFIFVILLGFMLWIINIFHGGKDSSQFQIFFGNCRDFFADMLNVVGYSAQKDVYNNTMYTGLGEKAYPPLTYVITYFFSRLVNMQPYYEKNNFLGMYTEPRFLIIFVIYIMAQLVIFYEIVRNCKNGPGILKCCTGFAVLCSLPMLYSIERGNTIILTVCAAMVYLFYYDSGSRFRREIALVALAVAVAFKITPAILGVLLIFNKQWKDVVKALVYGVIMGVVPFFFFEGGLSNFALMLRNIGMNLASYTSAEGCTLLASILSFHVQYSDGLVSVMKIITLLCCMCFLVLAFVSKVRWEKLLAISMILIILPSHSGYYCILYSIPAIIAFLNAKEHANSDLFVLLAFLMIMQPFQMTPINAFFNYHTALLIITCALVFRCFFTIIKGMRLKKYKCV